LGEIKLRRNMKANFQFLSAKERENLSAEDLGDPSLKLFPILTQKDVDEAPKRVTALTNPDEVKQRILSIAERKGFTVPNEWQVKSSEFSTGSEDTGTPSAEFELDSEKDSQDGEYILRTGKIFEAGTYPDKQFEISPEELCEAIADFKPVDLDLEHMPTILDGKLGKLEAVALGSDGWSLVGTVRLPKWLDKQLGDAERKVSATWDRISKKLTKLALVRNPRVKDAAIYAAFMANEFVDKVEGSTETELANTIQQYIEEHFSKKTWDGMSIMQGIHDTAARSGAVCYESKAKYNEAKEAGFVSESEAKSIQTIHDTSIKGGAMCSFMKDRSGNNAASYYNEEKKEMTFNDIKKFFSNLPDDLEIEAKEPNVDEKAAAELKAREEAVKAAEVALAEQKSAFDAEVAAAEAKKDEVKTEEVVEVENSEPEKSEREIELEAELAEIRQVQTKSEAEKFADGEIKAERAFPAEREALIALFAQASADDNTSSAKVAFKGKDKEGKEETLELSRVEALKKLYAVRKPHNFSYEEIADTGAGVLDFGRSDNADDYLAEAEKLAKEYAARKKKTLQQA
jgi:hypothetical protein